MTDMPLIDQAKDEHREAVRKKVLQRRRDAALKERNRLRMIRIISAVIVFGAWEIYGWNSMDIIFTPFTTVLWQLGVMISGAPFMGGLTYPGAFLYSISMFLSGLVIGSLVGIALGVAMGRFKGFEAAVGMYIYAVYSTPLVALIPLITLWFGFGISSQLIIISMFVMFPLTIAVYNGVRSVDPALVEVAKSFRANERAMWKHVIVPSVVPYIVTGLSQGVAMGLVGMFISEIYTQLSGMGQLLASTANAYRTADMLAVLLTVMIMGIFFRWVIETFRKRMAPWFNPDTKR